jgi:hypothetical protein
MWISFRIQSRERDAFAIRRKVEFGHRNPWQNCLGAAGRAVLTPTYPTSNKAIVAVPWGNYRSDITGGTGKFNGTTGYLDYFGMADFDQNTLVLRYRGEVCHAQWARGAQKTWWRLGKAVRKC